MKLSVIIVNYNVCVLLRQAVNSVKAACVNIDHEIFVVDNASADRSVEMIEREHPDVIVIANIKNKGVAKASNQALAKARGEYVLLLDPDTITKKDTLCKAIEFMDHHEDAGGVGVRMISPRGDFQPESKRGLPQHWTTFFKLTGLYRMLSKSRLYNRNHTYRTDEFETTEVDILSGTFMLLRRSVLKITGYLDERFFIYGADIDLSCRIRQAGYKNYYFPKTYIIHFKEQSIRKYSWAYIRHYYGAMFIFAGKYMFKAPKLSIKLKGLGQPYPSLYEIE